MRLSEKSLESTGEEDNGKDDDELLEKVKSLKEMNPLSIFQ